MTQDHDTNSDSHSEPVSVDAQVEQELAAALGDGQTLDELIAAEKDPEADATPDDSTPERTPRGQDMQKLARGRISAIEGDDVFVKVHGVEGKDEGIVPLEQFDRPPRVGSIMEFVIHGGEQPDGLLKISREGAVGRASWDQIQKGSTVEARVIGSNKGGLELELIGGIRGFMPMSQIDLHHVDNVESFHGQKITAAVQEVNRRSKQVVLSRRHYLEGRRLTDQKKLWAEIEVGQTREGVVSSLMAYGAFVDLGGLDGLIHVSDMSYTRVDKPEDVLKQGQKVQVKVLKIDREQQRVGLGLKQLAPDPWEGVELRIRVGDQLSVRVVRLADFGVFVELEPGLEGLLPISELSWQRIHSPSEVVQEGDMISAAVLKVDAPQQRISLSLKQAQGDPWVGAEHKYAKHSIVEGTALRATEFGAFIELQRGVEGLVHISELADRHVNNVEDVLKTGQTEKFRVLDVDEEKRRISLSLKAVEHWPAEGAADTNKGASGKAPRRDNAPTRAKQAAHDKSLKGGMGNAGGLGMGLKDLKF